MKTIKAILVDDEVGARDVLNNLLARFCPSINLIGKFSNLPEAVKLLKRDPSIQLVFLDIELPDYSGFEILSFFDNPPSFKIIFVTAYNKYALKAFELAAIDYLVKPVDIDRLKSAVEKAQTTVSHQDLIDKYHVLNETLGKGKIEYLIVNVKGVQDKIKLNEVIAFEANEAYSIIHTKRQKYIVSKNLKHYENLLSNCLHFMRIHKSWLVNINCIDSYSKNQNLVVLNSKIEAKLSKYKKQTFEEALNKNSIN